MRPPPPILLLVCLTGCSAIPAAQAPPTRPDGPPTAYRIGVAPVPLQLARSEQPKGYSPAEVTSPDALARELARWVSARGRYAGVELHQAGDRKARLEAAWRDGQDLLLEVEVTNLKTHFDGHNGWWIPNIANWLFWIIPSFFVATEEYSLACDVEARIVSVDSARVLRRRRFRIETKGTFDEFDRGWQPLGFLTPLNDADNWRQIAGKLLPATRSRLAAKVSAWVSEPAVIDHLDSPEGRRRLKKTMALVIGLSEYPDPIRLPRLRYAARDAAAFGKCLIDAGALEPHHVLQILDAEATRAGVDRAFATLAKRLRPQDQLVVYFAGYGGRSRDGTENLQLHGTAERREAMALGGLARRLSTLAGAKLVILDTSFDGRGRSFRDAATATASNAGLTALARDCTVLLATSPGGHLLLPEHLAGSLFAYHLRRGLAGAADRNRDGRLSPTELYQAVSRRVVAQAAYLGKSQRPRALGLGRPISLQVERREDLK